jgi:hypothetical protein
MTAGPRSAPAEEHLVRIAFRARQSAGGIGALVLAARFENGEHFWDCIIEAEALGGAPGVVGDGHELHYIRVISTELGPFTNVAPEEVEEGIERFAATLPADHRLYHLLNTSPLHMDAHGNVSD